MKSKSLLLALLLLTISTAVSAAGYELPGEREVPKQELPFPCDWQTVIFRNYGYVSSARIAEVLRCSEKTVEKEARRMGLSRMKHDDIWQRSGYITIIRNNWHLLSYPQLLTLLGFSEDRLAWILQEEDFLNVKLGGYKPVCEPITFQPLTKQETKTTKKLAAIIRKGKPRAECKPFRFFDDKEMEGADSLPSQDEPLRMIHGYLSPCGDVFTVDSRSYLPDALLKQYADAGINGIFLHGVLSTLSEYPFDTSLSEGYKERREEFRRLIMRCRKYGIGIYLYMNEPRGLCTSRPEVKSYLHDAVYDLVSDLQYLGGIMTITMSENPTHCKSHGNATDCELCRDIPAECLAAEVNNIIYGAIRDAGVSTRLIANLWGWEAYMGWTEEQIDHGIEMLDKGIGVLCVSEFGLSIEKAGVASTVGEYSLSNPGPSERSRKSLLHAAQTGHKTLAKVQINNSWECSVVPYMPVFDLELEHLQNLRAIGVMEYMLTWTLGGYPSPMLSLVGESRHADFDMEQWYRDVYGKDAKAVHKAVTRFCQAFRLYPYSGGALYCGPKNLGMANLWSLQPDGKPSTMVGFSFDDYESWIGPYTVESYMDSMAAMLRLWKEGLAGLAGLKTAQAKELRLFAQVVYLQYEADLLHTRYAVLKRDLPQNGAQLREVMASAEENTRQMLQLIGKHPAIAYEASNSYFFTSRCLLEKLAQLSQLRMALE